MIGVVSVEAYRLIKFRVKSCNSHLVRGKWWHVDFKEMPTMWQYKELEGKEKQKEVLSL